MEFQELAGGWKGRPKRRLGWKALVSGGLILCALVISGLTWLRNSSPADQEAPEAEQVLSAQRQLPFQVLIPAYLPPKFNRARLAIDTSLAGPAGEPMIQLSYPARHGETLVLNEWLPLNPDPAAAGSQPGSSSQYRVVRCRCHDQSGSQCGSTDMEISVGSLHILLKSSTANLITAQQMQFILKTLGPAANRQVYTAMQDVADTNSVPTAVDIPVNASGVQELTLVVTPQGYTPAHFAVKRGLAVKLTFRQLGEVGCGDEMIITWGDGKSADLKLASPDDVKTLKFTPNRPGDYPFHCPHLIYQGIITVLN
jgi:hypothetical protein